MSAAAQEGQAPRRIDDYRILGLLGTGGVGVVYRAQHIGTGEVVALKTVRARSSAHLSSVRREILALHRLKHPGIVRILDGGVSEGRPWYAMELLTGQRPTTTSPR
jgi:serine/threonine protein kinase